MSPRHFGGIAPFDEEPTIKLLVLDVDGVLTDGTKIYTPDGVLGKRFFERDFTAMKQFKEHGIQVVCMTSDPMNLTLLGVKSRHIRVTVVHRDNKLDALKRLIVEHNATPKQTIYVGDDLEDKPVLDWLKSQHGRARIPVNAHPLLLRYFSHIMSNGGSGVAEALYWEMFCDG